MTHEPDADVILPEAVRVRVGELRIDSTRDGLRVLLDGQRLAAFRSLTLRIAVDEVVTVTLERALLVGPEGQ